MKMIELQVNEHKIEEPVSEPFSRAGKRIRLHNGGVHNTSRSTMPTRSDRARRGAGHVSFDLRFSPRSSHTRMKSADFSLYLLPRIFTQIQPS